MNKITIDNSQISSTTNQIEINLVEIDDIKVMDALLTMKVTSISGNSKFVVNYEADCVEESKWNNVETIKDISLDEKITINISDEIQDALDKQAQKIILTFVGENSSIEFNECQLERCEKSWNGQYKFGYR